MKRIQDFYTICHGAWSARISATDGGNIISLKRGGEDILRPLLYEEERTIDPLRHGAPILLPANRTANAAFKFNERLYQLPYTHPNVHMHGLVYKQQFIVEQWNTSSIQLGYTACSDVYPFPFRLSVRYNLLENGCRADYRLQNLSDFDMPYTFGLHTTFANVMHLQIPIGQRFERDAHKIPTGLLLKLNDKERSYLTGSKIFQETGGFYTAAGHTAIINQQFLFSVSKNFDQWILFRPDDQGTLCIEPQSGTVNGLNMPLPHHRILSSNQIEVYSWQINWLS